MNTIISVSNISKRYRLGLKEKQAETLTGQIANVIKSPLQNLKRLKDLNRFQAEDESVFWALKEVSFEVKEGEVLGIIGKNGAGKSTLLKILSQITEPTSGRIEIHGRVASLLEVGTGFHPELSGRENIYMNGTILGMTRKEIDSKLDEIIDFSGVEKFIDTPVKFYSSGMKVRLGFSVAAHLDPEILIIDEVLAVGDFEFQKKCLGKMEDVSRNQGRTVLFVSHNMGAIKNISNRCILLTNGLVSYDGNVDQVIGKYLNDFSDSEFSFTPNEKAWVSNINIFSEGKNEIYCDNNWEIEIKVISELFLANFVVAIGLLGSNEEPITTSWQSPIEIEKGIYIFKFLSKDFFLNEGEYYLCVGLTSNNEQIQYLDKVKIIKVFQDKSKGYSIYKTSKFGFASKTFIHDYKKI